MDIKGTRSLWVMIGMKVVDVVVVCEHWASLQMTSANKVKMLWQ